MEERAEKKK